MSTETTTLAAPTAPDRMAVQRAYDAVGRAYDRYADGDDPGALFPIGGAHARADRQIWDRIDRRLQAERARGRRALRVLDVGCGPGTWLARVVVRAAELGFDVVDATGVDLCDAMAAEARTRTASASCRVRPAGTRAHVEIAAADACAFLPRLGRRYDLVLCLYSVLNHLGPAERTLVAGELGRLTRGELLVSVRSAFGPPTIYVDSLDHARDFQQDHAHDRMDVDLLDGRHLVIPSHTFQAAELDALFAPHLAHRTVRGLDLFHARFAPDRRWHRRDPAADAFLARLDRLERDCAADPDLVDHATHLLLAARPGRD